MKHEINIGDILEYKDGRLFKIKDILSTYNCLYSATCLNNNDVYFLTVNTLDENWKNISSITETPRQNTGILRTTRQRKVQAIKNLMRKGS